METKTRLLTLGVTLVLLSAHAMADSRFQREAGEAVSGHGSFGEGSVTVHHDLIPEERAEIDAEIAALRAELNAMKAEMRQMDSDLNQTDRVANQARAVANQARAVANQANAKADGAITFENFVIAEGNHCGSGKVTGRWEVLYDQNGHSTGSSPRVGCVMP